MFSDRCLNDTSISPFGFFFLVSRLAYLAREMGGWSEKKAQRVASQLVAKCVCAACLRCTASGNPSFKVALAPEWKPSWPQPDAQECATVGLNIIPDGDDYSMYALSFEELL